MKHLIAIMLIALCSGCATTEWFKSTYNNPGWPGYITSSTSEFDNKSSHSLEPAYLHDGYYGKSPFRLGLRWNSQLGKDTLLLVAEWGEATNFDPKNTLDLNIDGQFISLKPSDPRQYGIKSEKFVMSSGPISTPVSMGNQTKKAYVISRDTIERIIKANKVVIRTHFLNSFWEERFEPSQEDASTYQTYPYIWAKAGFKKFLRLIPIS